MGACSIGSGEYFGPVPKPDPTHFRWCNSAEPEYLDPALATSTTDMKIVYSIFDGLTEHDPDGLPMPSLATSWDVSPDQRVFTFHLRHDARWSNGRPLTSADFVYSLTRVLHPLTGANNAESLWKIVHARAFTDDRVRMVLRDTAGFHAGDAVEVVVADDAKAPPSPNERIARTKVILRGGPDANAEAWSTSKAHAALTIIELGGAARDWAYVYDPDGGGGDGVYGWAPLAALDEPHGELDYTVRALPDRPTTATAPRQAVVKGRDLLMLPELLGIRAPDPYTLVIETEGPTPYLIDLSVQRGWRPTPREAVSRWPRAWTRPEHIVSSGGFELREWRQRDRIELVKSLTFWDRAHVRLERATIYAMNDQSANASYYYQGGCDALAVNNIPASWLPVISGDDGHPARKDYTRAAFLGIYYYMVNVKKLDNVHLRRALSHALDQSVLPLILKGGQIPTEQYTPGMPIAQLSDEDLAACGVSRDTPGVAMMVQKGVCYVPPMGPRYDVAQAKAELAIARAEMGASFPKSITVKFNTGVEYHKHIAEWIQAQWKQNLGLDVQLESQEFKTFLAATKNHQFDVARLGGIGNFPDPEGEFLTDYRCGNPNNRSDWCNQDYERLYHEAEQEPDRRKRLAIIRQAEDLMVNDVPAIPLYVYTQHHLQRPYVKGLAINFVDQQNLRDVWIDPDWKAHQP